MTGSHTVAVRVRLAKSQVLGKIDVVLPLVRHQLALGLLLANLHTLALGSQAVSEGVRHRAVSVLILQAVRVSQDVLQPAEAVAEVANAALKATT